MFIHETHLPQVLKPEDYTSQRQFECERHALFASAWHLVGSTAQFQKPGDFITLELYGIPLIAWRSEAGIQTYLNVCPHRFARLSGEETGSSPARLKCQYHGWEFDHTGATKRIPDAPSFKPLTQGQLGLTTFRTETVGQLIFCCFTDDAPPLREFLGEGYEVAEMLFGADRRFNNVMDYQVETNWKCKVENSIESYHVDMVHPATFRITPEAEECEHEFSDRWSTYATVQEAATAIDRRLDKFSSRMAGVPHDPQYKHYYYYPHIMFGKMRLFSWVELIIPLSPSRVRVIGHFYCYGGEAAGRRARWFSRALKVWQRKFFKVLANEDNGALEEVHRGLSSTMHPSTGLISIREERCHHFQEYIRDNVKTQELPTSADQLWPAIQQQGSSCNGEACSTHQLEVSPA